MATVWNTLTMIVRNCQAMQMSLDSTQNCSCMCVHYHSYYKWLKNSPPEDPVICTALSGQKVDVKTRTVLCGKQKLSYVWCRQLNQVGSIQICIFSISSSIMCRLASACRYGFCRIGGPSVTILQGSTLVRCPNSCLKRYDRRWCHLANQVCQLLISLSLS